MSGVLRAPTDPRAALVPWTKWVLSAGRFITSLPSRQRGWIDENLPVAIALGRTVVVLRAGSVVGLGVFGCLDDPGEIETWTVEELSDEGAFLACLFVATDRKSRGHRNPVLRELIRLAHVSFPSASVLIYRRVKAQSLYTYTAPLESP